MRKFFDIFISVLLMVSCTLFGVMAGISYKYGSAKIIVATDIHYLSSKLNDNSSAFNTMLTNSDGKMVQYCDEIFSAFSDEVIAQKPDVLILSGDLTMNGEKESHQDFVKKLKYIQSNGVPVLAIAGNHDLPSQEISLNPVGYKGEEVYNVDGITVEEFKSLYYEFGMKQAVSVDESSLSYMYKINDKLYALMLDTNVYGQNFVQNGTFDWIKSQLEMAKKNDAKVISVSHQNVFAHNDKLSFGYSLYNADELLEIYKDYGVLCNLSGHIHMQHIKNDDFTEIVTSSLVVGPIQYGVIDYNGNLNYKTQKVNVSNWAKKNNIDNKELLNFDLFSSDFFKKNGTSRIMTMLEDLGFSDKEKELIAHTFSELNSSYFAGTKYDATELEDGIKLCKKQEGFLSAYIDTMLKEAENDYNSVTINR